MIIKKSGGLKGVIAGETAISSTDKGLKYRGYDIYDLTEQCQFEEVLYLLLFGDLPAAAQLNNFRNNIVTGRSIPDSLKTVLQNIPATAMPMDVLRTAISFLGDLEPEHKSPSNIIKLAARLIGVLPSVLFYWHHFSKSGIKIDTESEEGCMAAYILQLLQRSKPSEKHINAMNKILILYAEHGFNTSTYATRTSASTQTDFYSCIITGICALKGPLHGGANKEALDMILKFDDAQNAISGINDMLKNNEKVMGFGHRVYKSGDPRNILIKSISHSLSIGHPAAKLYEISEVIENVMLMEKGIYPNLDFYIASAFHFMDIPKSFFTTIFAFARTAGWTAHIIEQRSQDKLIRPNAKYIGQEERSFIALKDRVY